MPIPADWNEFEDDLADAIADSIDMDWNSRDGAKAVVRWLNENAPARGTTAAMRQAGVEAALPIVIGPAAAHRVYCAMSTAPLAEMLAALQEANRALMHYEWYANPKSGWAGDKEFVRHMVDAAIANATSA